jgi:hypothetical protein
VTKPIDRAKLGRLHGLAVEGITDKKILESFLSAGENAGYWSNWRAKVSVESVGNVTTVLKEVDPANNAGKEVWGLIDRDWRTDTEVNDLENKFPQLLILPRIMIDNYLIDPTEFIALLPPNLAARLDQTKVQTNVDKHLNNWLKHGAISSVLHENGALQFCRPDGNAFPSALIDRLETDRTKIVRQLETWYDRLDPHKLIAKYDTRLADFNEAAHQDKLQRCIHGKKFFNEVIVQRVLKKLPRTPDELRDRDGWIDVLTTEAKRSTLCPPDLVPIFQRVI